MIIWYHLDIMVWYWGATPFTGIDARTYDLTRHVLILYIVFISIAIVIIYGMFIVLVCRGIVCQQIITIYSYIWYSYISSIISYSYSLYCYHYYHLYYSHYFGCSIRHHYMSIFGEMWSIALFLDRLLYCHRCVLVVYLLDCRRREGLPWMWPRTSPPAMIVF